MTRVVMMTLVTWDDRGEEMNQEEVDQDVADEVIGHGYTPVLGEWDAYINFGFSTFLFSR